MRPLRRVGTAAAKAIGPLGASLGISPRWLRWRVPETRALFASAASTHHTVVELDQNDHSPLPLPANVRSRSELPRESEKWGRSFFDVPGRERDTPKLAVVEDAHVLAAFDHWQLQHFAVVSDRGIRYAAPGLRWMAAHRELALSDEPECDHDRVFWPWETWRSNYYIWLFRHLTKLVWMVDHSLTEDLVVPYLFEPTSFQLESAACLGIDLDSAPRMTSQVLRAKELRLMSFKGVHPYAVSLLRQGLDACRSESTGRRILIVRKPKDAGIPDRSIANEREVSEALYELGFEPVDFGAISFEDQVRTCSQADVIVGLHGAGLANTVFCHPGAHIIEIVDPRFPNPTYYELAAVSGLTYWKLDGVPTDETYTRGYGAVSVVLHELIRVVSSIERRTGP